MNTITLMLTRAQAMTIHVAMQSFTASLLGDGLGDDDHGKTMVQLYLERIDEIERRLCPWLDSHRDD